MASVKHDSKCLISSNVEMFKTLLRKYNKESSETIQLYKNVLKINKRNKKQQRIFLLTNKAIYNIKPKNSTIQRRIDLLQIASITLSSISTQFTLNVPLQYDYQFDAIEETIQNDIISAICKQMNKLQHSVMIHKINNKTTKDWTVSKDIMNKINNAPDVTLRSLLALEHLENMGFKRNMARNQLNKNKGNLALTIQTLICDFVTDSEKCKGSVVRSPFKSAEKTPSTVKLSPISVSLPSPMTPITKTSPYSTPTSLSPSITQEVDELANMFSLYQQTK